MSRLIVCECGVVVHGETEPEVLSAARRHMEANHPVIAEKITDSELLALSHEETAEGGSTGA